MNIVKTFFVLLLVFSPFLLAQEKGAPFTLDTLDRAAQRDAAYYNMRNTRDLPTPPIHWERGVLLIGSSAGTGQDGLWLGNNEFKASSTLASGSRYLPRQPIMSDVSYIPSGVQAEYSTHLGPAVIDAMLRVRQRKGLQDGALADIRIEVAVYGGKYIGLQTYVQSTWASRDAMNSDFGMTNIDAALIGMPIYQSEAGLRNYLVGVTGKLDLDTDWMAIGSVEYNSLAGDAADSPVTDQKNSQAVRLGVMYKF